MRILVLISFILFLFSCKTTKIPLKTDLTNTLEKDTSDTIYLVEDTLKEESYLPNIYIEPNFSYNKISYIESEIKEPLDVKVKKYTKKEEKVSPIIVDNTSSNYDKDSDFGMIAYSVPKEMEIGKFYKIKLRISKKKDSITKDNLIKGDRNISIIDEDGTIYLDNIRINDNVSAVIIGPDGYFTISSLSSEWQIIEDEGYTEWTWSISPKKSGKNNIKMILKIKIINKENVTQKDIIIFDKNIEVKTNFIFSLKSFIFSYWQWLATTTIIPFIIFIFKRRKKKKEENKNEQ